LGHQAQIDALVADTYRQRFGIETSYRQLNEARIKTCTRNPGYDFFSSPGTDPAQRVGVAALGDSVESAPGPTPDSPGAFAFSKQCCCGCCMWLNRSWASSMKRLPNAPLNEGERRSAGRANFVTTEIQFAWRTPR